ncbi:hypothetical protein [Flexivirga caeni]|uniref:Uncharacterized protein n=1 Tax=Flexivirga caeni TaxID=2294115 RepID=A0A3M9LXE0_9MICO|nr:hypothetical protein [Flexivirga caeni]RNI17028.1 hypothetical protein EFY87_19750 [Flexivirga caeni]
MGAQSTAPTYGALLVDLKQVRRLGAGRLRRQELPALRRVAVLLDLCDNGDSEPAPIVDVLRQAVDQMGGGVEQDATEYILGLPDGAGLWTLGRRRSKAASLFTVQPETFRKNYETEFLEQVAEHLLGLLHDQHLRVARVEMAERRHPADSRLAVQWVERFEAYYRIWTPVYALAADLEAALATYQEGPSEHLPWDPDSEQEYQPYWQARGYARSALYDYAQFQLELKRFKSVHGGLWLASDAQTEQDIADAVYRIGWHNDLNDEDDSWLRRMLADTRYEEPEQFWNVIQAFPHGIHIHDLWQRMVEKSASLTSDEEKLRSQAWCTSRACHDYTRMVDEDWTRIADWYKPAATPRRNRVDGARLYRKWLAPPCAHDA